jgi:TetR/AcrR family transcriptional repressor of nem operon
MRTNEAKQKLLDAALLLFRKCGYTDTTVEDLCRAAGVTKGTFFHYFSSKEALALAAIQYWNEWTGALFASAPYQQVADPRDRILAYIDFRASLIEGDIPEWTCLLGTLVQETFLSHPALRDACGAGIEAHTQTLVPTIEAAKRLYAPNATWSAPGLGRHLQAALQGAFVLAKANNNAQAALEAIEHLRQYVEQLIPIPKQETK